jgi:hypothetical protein
MFWKHLDKQLYSNFTDNNLRCDEYSPPGYNIVQFSESPTFWPNTMPQSSGLNNMPGMKAAEVTQLATSF